VSAVVLGSGLAISPVAANAAASNQVFGAHPVHQGQTTLPGGHFNFALAPGESVSDAVVVENFSDHPSISTSTAPTC
jgi:hypothetical protein